MVQTQSRNIDGINYKLDSNRNLSDDEIQNTINQIRQSPIHQQLTKISGKIEALGICNVTKKIYGVDQYITLTSVPGGQAPFTVQFKKGNVNIGPIISVPPYTYQYPILPTDAGTAGTSYNFTATVSDSCTGSIPVTDTGCNVTIYNQLICPNITATLGGSPVTCPITANVGQNISMSISGIVGGSGTFTYQWYIGPAIIPGATSPVLATFPASTSNAGTYSVTVTDTASGQNCTKLCILSVNCNVVSVGLTVA